MANFLCYYFFVLHIISFFCLLAKRLLHFISFFFYFSYIITFLIEYYNLRNNIFLFVALNVVSKTTLSFRICRLVRNLLKDLLKPAHKFKSYIKRKRVKYFQKNTERKKVEKRKKTHRFER